MVLGALDTFWVTTADVTGLQLSSPLYTAVIEWLPTESVVLVNDALPPLTGTVPSNAAPSRNCTLPVAAAGKRVAVNTTDCPAVAGLSDDTSEIDVGALFTVCVTGGEVLAPYPAFGLYAAESVWLPTASCVVVSWALPPLSAAVPNCVAPS